MKVVIGPLRIRNLTESELLLLAQGWNPGLGGTNWVSLELARRLARTAGLQVSLTFENNADEPARAVHVPSTTVANSSRRAERDTVFLIPVASMSTFLEAAGDVRGRYNLILWSHHPHDLEAQKWIDQELADAVVSIGQYQYASNPFRGVPHVRIPNPIPTWVDRVTTKSFAQRPPVLGFLGSLSRHKHFDKIAAEWPKVHDRHPDLGLSVVGGSGLYGTEDTWNNGIPADPDYATLLSQLLGGASSSVKFHGTKAGDQVAENLANWRLLLGNPVGSSEAYPGTLIEAVGSGVPPLASNDFGNWDIMQSFPETSLKHPSRLLQSLEPLLCEDQLGERLVARCRAVYGELLETDTKLEDRWLRLFESVVTRTARSKASPRQIEGDIGMGTSPLPRWLQIRILRRNARLRLSRRFPAVRNPRRYLTDVPGRKPL